MKDIVLTQSEVGLVVIEEMSYFLMDMRSGFGFCQVLIRAVGTLLMKLSLKHRLPVVVTSVVSNEVDEQKYLISPWLNFVNDSIFIEKLVVSESSLSDNKGDRRPILRMFNQSKWAPFCTTKIEGGPKEHKYVFKFRVSSLKECISSAPKRHSRSEKVI